MNCEKCGAEVVGPDYIKRHVWGLLDKGRDPKSGKGYLNTMDDVKGWHRIKNEGKLKFPCNYCISTYRKMIEDAVGSYKKSN